MCEVHQITKKKPFILVWKHKLDVFKHFLSPRIKTLADHM